MRIRSSIFEGFFVVFKNRGTPPIHPESAGKLLLVFAPLTGIVIMRDQKQVFMSWIGAPDLGLGGGYQTLSCCPPPQVAQVQPLGCAASAGSSAPASMAWGSTTGSATD